MVVIRYKSGLRLNRHLLPETNTARAPSNMNFSGIKIRSGKNEIILDPKRLDRIRERRQLELRSGQLTKLPPDIKGT